MKQQEIWRFVQYKHRSSHRQHAQRRELFTNYAELAGYVYTTGLPKDYYISGAPRVHTWLGSFCSQDIHLGLGPNSQRSESQYVSFEIPSRSRLEFQ